MVCGVQQIGGEPWYTFIGLTRQDTILSRLQMALELTIMVPVYVSDPLASNFNSLIGLLAVDCEGPAHERRFCFPSFQVNLPFKLLGPDAPLTGPDSTFSSLTTSGRAYHQIESTH